MKVFLSLARYYKLGLKIRKHATKKETWEKKTKLFLFTFFSFM